MEPIIHYHLYDIRTARKLSERELAEKSGVSKSQINNIENGLKHPTVYTLCLLSLALGVSPYDLFSLES
ncbi:MAG: helix-turn-helix transcriptional regulator [Lachnospiraceae bacterium]|nr:helix-turn-helix transcriptional regulator [Lachnospiraceae bacterium]